MSIFPLSNLIPKTLEVSRSRINGRISIIRYFNGVALIVDDFQQSGPYFDKLWGYSLKKLFDQKVMSPPKNVLLLGLGGGTIPKILDKLLKPEQAPDYFAVEIDPEIIRLSEKYFKIKNNPRLKIIVGDAFKEVSSMVLNKEQFNLTVVDLFIANLMPRKIADYKFLHHLARLCPDNGKVIFNFSLINNRAIKLDKFKKRLQKIFAIEEVLSERKYNRIIVCKKRKRSVFPTDLRQTYKYAQYMRTLGWEVSMIKGCQIFLRNLPFFPNVSLIKIQRPERPIPFSEIDQLAKLRRTLLVNIQPTQPLFSEVDLISWGYCQNQWSLMPTKTIVLNISGDKKDILCQLSPEARRKINFADKNLRFNSYLTHSIGGEKDFGSSLATFIAGWDQFSSRKNIYSSKEVKMAQLAKTFGKDTHIFLLHDKETGELLWGLFIITIKDVAYYLHTFTSLPGRKFSASYLGVWQAIDFLVKSGIKKLDFEGVFDERFPRQRRDWLGLTQFKKDWGGDEIYFPPSYTKYYNPIVKLLFRIFT